MWILCVCFVGVFVLIVFFLLSFFFFTVKQFKSVQHITFIGFGYGCTLCVCLMKLH